MLTQSLGAGKVNRQEVLGYYLKISSEVYLRTLALRITTLSSGTF